MLVLPGPQQLSVSRGVIYFDTLISSMGSIKIAPTGVVLLHNEMIRSIIDEHPANSKERVERLGADIGIRLIERLCVVHSRPMQGKPNDVIMFICKEFWSAVFGHSVARLRQQRNVYTLTDDNFYWASNISGQVENDPATTNFIDHVLFFTSAMIGGALTGLNVTGPISAVVSGNECIFTIGVQSMAP